MLKLADKPVETAAISDAALDQLFREARTHNVWQDKPVPEALLREAVDLAKMGPTSANTLPARFVFVRSPEAKAKLKPAMMEANVEKTMAAPVTAVVAHDNKFFDHAPRLFPHADIRPWFNGNKEFAERTAFQNGSLQAAYLILALRSLGLDTGPMTGFNNAAVDGAFFPNSNVKSNILINIGYGDAQKVFPRNPRFAFDEIARFA
ncbi:MAG: malonic semialdehyde reductase [Proteobacteria bacterium]|nr:malonic semialdehyde reductase [Pseudomonadota bacterium]